MLSIQIWIRVYLAWKNSIEHRQISGPNADVTKYYCSANSFIRIYANFRVTYPTQIQKSVWATLWSNPCVRQINRAQSKVSSLLWSLRRWIKVTTRWSEVSRSDETERNVFFIICRVLTGFRTFWSRILQIFSYRTDRRGEAAAEPGLPAGPGRSQRNDPWQIPQHTDQQEKILTEKFNWKPKLKDVFVCFFVWWICIFRLA